MRDSDAGGSAMLASRFATGGGKNLRREQVRCFFAESILTVHTPRALGGPGVVDVALNCHPLNSLHLGHLALAATYASLAALAASLASSHSLVCFVIRLSPIVRAVSF